MPIVWSAVGAAVLPNVGGWVGAVVVSRNLKWYETLKKPTWTPPNWSFGPVWTILYTGIGYASYLVWRDGGGFEGNAQLPLALYACQLALNWAWTPIFFGTHNILLALANISLLYISAAMCGYSFYQINRFAGLLFIPYMAWLTLASYLNYFIYRHNPVSKSLKEELEK